MNNSNTYYQRNRERFLDQAKNRYNYEGGKEQTEEYYKHNKERLSEKKQNKYRKK